LTEAYNDSVKDDAYGSYAFVKDEHVEGFVSQYDLCNYQQLLWEKACGWFKKIVKDYSKAIQDFTMAGTHQPDFMASVDRKPQTYYYRMYVVANPECHKAFNVLLDDALFSESKDDKCGDKKKKRKKIKTTTQEVQVWTRRLQS
jgi:hypothetical protein